jgi:hypothetical protein
MGFPTSDTPNMMDTMGMRLLRRFSSSLLSTEYPSGADAPPNLSVSRRKVELLFNILKNLQENTESALAGGNVSPVSRKKIEMVANDRRIDPSPFDSMGINVPTTDAEVRDVYVVALSRLRSILEVCGFITDGLRVKLNSPSTISSFSGSRCYRRVSNPRTPGQSYQRKGCLPRRRKRLSWSRINLRTRRFQQERSNLIRTAVLEVAFGTARALLLSS